MSITITNPQDIVVTLEVGQGPAGPSTVAAQAAQALSEAAALRSETARNTILATELTALANANSAALSASSAANSASNSLISSNSATLRALESSASAAQAGASAASAANSAALAQIAQQGGAKVFASFATATAGFAGLTNGQVILIVKDETRANVSAYYQASGSPVTSIAFINQAEFYFSPVPYIKSDSQNNLITKLLILTGAIPQNPASLKIDFTSNSFEQR